MASTRGRQERYQGYKLEGDTSVATKASASLNVVPQLPLLPCPKPGPAIEVCDPDF